MTRTKSLLYAKWISLDRPFHLSNRNTVSLYLRMKSSFRIESVRLAIREINRDGDSILDADQLSEDGARSRLRR